MSGLILNPELPTTSVTISKQMTAMVQDIAQRGIAIDVRDEVSFTQGNEIYKEIHEMDKAIEAERVDVKAPYFAICKQIDEQAKYISGMLKDAKIRLGQEIKRFTDAENARREAARLAALKEAQRLEDEAYEKAEAERAAKIAAQADLPPDERESLPVFSAPVIVPVAPAFTPKPLTSAVRSKPVVTLIIDDVSLIPREIAGIKLLIPDEAAIKQLLKGGAKIPGCRLEESTSTAPTGR